MKLDNETCYRALGARDSRFDGLFFVGVTTTGIYCRPVCPARTPRADRCRFFDHAAAAESEGFRPCLRCRPELAPGDAPVDAVGRTARLAAARIEAGALNEEGTLDTLALELGVGSRQLRRAIRQEFGVSPIALAQTRRLLLAKQLLTETSLPLIRVAEASGFGSVRRFNALFRTHYGMPPSRLRRKGGAQPDPDSLSLTLAYRPPFAWEAMFRFLAGRATKGTEVVSAGEYLRTIDISGKRGWLQARPIPGRNLLTVRLSMSLAAVLPMLLSRIRSLFDLDARPDAISLQLTRDARLVSIADGSTGHRIPGCLNGFELAVRAILGQRISVSAATTLAGRLVSIFGEPFDAPHPRLNRVSPSPERLAEAPLGTLTGLGIAPLPARAIIALSRAVADRTISLEPCRDPEGAIERLRCLPGVGEWTAQYVAMRALRWPDAFPSTDLGLLRASGMSSARELAAIAEAWRPWRAYAAMLLWDSLHRT
jgi:AraC family transcriptional regulator of adaptative response / DNA-3-methyladenine glycosylase II